MVPSYRIQEFNRISPLRPALSVHCSSNWQVCAGVIPSLFLASATKVDEIHETRPSFLCHTLSVLLRTSFLSSVNMCRLRIFPKFQVLVAFCLSIPSSIRLFPLALYHKQLGGPKPQLSAFLINRLC